MVSTSLQPIPMAPPAPWLDPTLTADGLPRAWAPLRSFDGPGAQTLWFDVGAGAFAPLSREMAACFLDEAEALRWPVRRVAFLGRRAGADPVRPLETDPEHDLDHEPFRNRFLPDLAEEALLRGHEAVIVSAADAAPGDAEAKRRLLALRDRHGARLRLELALAHHTARLHDRLRGQGAFRRALKAIAWAVEHGLGVRVVGGLDHGESRERARAAYARLFRRKGLALDASAASALELSPPSPTLADPPEIAIGDWAALGAAPTDLPCASGRFVAQRADEDAPQVFACPFILDHPEFEMSGTLAGAERPVTLSHPLCSALCVHRGVDQ